MAWNWQLPEWPHFKYNPSTLIPLEKTFLQIVGGGFAILKHLESENKKDFIIEVLCNEGLKSAEIEGEILQRKSLQVSLQRHFGLVNHTPKIPPKERGMAELMWELYSTFQEPLTHQMLYAWHSTLMQGDNNLSEVGKYRTHPEPMQIIAGRLDKHEVHFEAPPSSKVYEEMDRYIQWFNKTSPSEPILAGAAIAHVYFESIHPFEDGNGRIGRALVEKFLSKSLGYPTLMAISQTITQRKKEYYDNLGRCNKTLDIEKWMVFFAEVLIQSQADSLKTIHFLIAKSTLLHRLEGQINQRQQKVLLRMFAEGLKGFAGGLSAENYIAMTKTSKATATRDLTDLVEKGALYKTGQLRHTRYWLTIREDSSF